MADGDNADTEIREATDADAMAFGDFLRAAWDESGPEAPGFAGASDAVIAEMAEPDAVRQRIGGPQRRMFLAWRKWEVVGFAATKVATPKTIELAGIIVRQSMAGSGIGRRLVDAAVDRARSDGFATMIVRTETTNSAAVGFYEALGFSASTTATEYVDGTAIEVWELTRILR